MKMDMTWMGELGITEAQFKLLNRVKNLFNCSVKKVESRQSAASVKTANK